MTKAVMVQGTMSGATVKAVDIRAGAAMIIAALGIEGTTEIEGVDVIERGYVDIVGKLAAIGADIKVADI